MAESFRASDLILSVGTKIMLLVSIYFLLALNLPTLSSFPANQVRSLFGKNVGTIANLSSNVNKSS